MTNGTAAQPDSSRFAGPLSPPSALRAAIRAGYRTPEPDCVPPLIEAATLGSCQQSRIVQHETLPGVEGEGVRDWAIAWSGG